MNRSIFWISIFTLCSPWFLILLHNRNIPHPALNRPVVQYVIDEVNTLRGEAINTGAERVAKVFVNKYFFVARFYVYQYLSVFDPHYLFFSAGPDPSSNPIYSGPLYISLLIPLLFGLREAWQKRKLYIVFLLSAAVYPAFFAETHETITRIPFFIALSAVSALGIISLRQKHKRAYYFVLIALLYEFLRFSHIYCSHYPRLLAEYWYKFK